MQGTSFHSHPGAAAFRGHRFPALRAEPAKQSRRPALYWLAAPTLFPSLACAAAPQRLDLTEHPVGFIAIAAFLLGYLFVVLEEITDLRKSKPMMLAAAIIWVAIAAVYTARGLPEVAEAAVRHEILEYGELLLFLIVSMTYMNALEERLVFHSVRNWLIGKGFDYRSLFWVSGVSAFALSSIVNNMAVAMLMTAVIMALGRDNRRFVALCCINIVVATNAGGTFSPFGDITTLMVWQQGVVTFWQFFALFLPAVVNFMLPAALMHFAVPHGRPGREQAMVGTKRGAKQIAFLFLLTIATTVIFHNVLHLPPALGMMAGLTYLQFFGYYLRKSHRDETDLSQEVIEAYDYNRRFDIFDVARMEWDTLLFFYGVVLCVGGIGFLGYLAHASSFLYGQLGPTTANVLVGIASAVVDNIPVMFAILSMRPDMSLGQWLLVTFTTGVGGSLLSVGSAAGVALMGQTKGVYTFGAHLKWLPVIALGYGGSILVHFWINGRLF